VACWITVTGHVGGDKEAHDYVGLAFNFKVFKTHLARAVTLLYFQAPVEVTFARAEYTATYTI
jgi:hypothetical protein